MMPMRLWRSTFGLVALVAVLFALATLGIGAVAYRVTHEAFEEQLDRRISAETAALIEEAQEEGLAGLAEAVRRREIARSTASLDYLLVDGAHHRLAGSMVTRVPSRPGYEELLAYRRGSTHGIAQALTTRIAGGTLIVAADRRDLQEIDWQLKALFAAALAAMLALGVAAAALVGWITRRRLARIDGTALAIISGELDRRVPRDGSGSEFDRLAGTLNRMLDRIAGLMANIRQVSSDVAHDLRTPLTRLTGHLDRALAIDEPAGRIAEIEAASAQAAELLEIFAALLRIAEIEGLADRLSREPVDLGALVEQMAETYRPDMEAKGHRLLCHVMLDVVMAGDRRLLSQAVANLLDNALRHTPSGTTVTLFVRREGGARLLGVSDDGPGVDEADAERLFQRFARGEQARSTPGNGLGLALVAAIAAAHGGRASIMDGAGFGIVLGFPGDPV